MQPALFQCWHIVYDAGLTFGHRCRIRPTINDRCTSQQTRDVDPMLFLMPCRHRRQQANIQTTLEDSRSRVVCTVLAGWYCCDGEAGQSTEGQSVLLKSRVKVTCQA